MGADRFIFVPRPAQFILLGERRTADLRQSADVGRRGESGGLEFLAVEPGLCEKMSDLKAIGGIVGLGLRHPGPRLDLRVEHHDPPPSRVVGDRRFRLGSHKESNGLGLLLGEVGEEAAGPCEERDRLDHRRRKVEVEQHRRDRHRHVHGQPAAPSAGHGRVESARKINVFNGDALLVGERQDALRARVDGLVDGVAEARHPVAAAVDLRRDRRHDSVGIAAGVDPFPNIDKDLAAEFGRSEDHRAAAEDAGRESRSGPLPRDKGPTWPGRACR